MSHAVGHNERENVGQSNQKMKAFMNTKWHHEQGLWEHEEKAEDKTNWQKKLS